MLPCNRPTDTELTQQYPGGTIASGWPDPDVMTAPTIQATHQGGGGVCKALSEGTWEAATAPTGTPREAAQEKEHDGHHSQDRRAIRVSTYGADPRPRRRNATTAVSSPFQTQMEEQEAARPAYRPHSEESVALPDTIWKGETEEDEHLVNPEGRTGKRNHIQKNKRKLTKP
ncbi:hypothetical protein NDU88_006911 [Pleurodeles waltl]|uniref:Uncharacterized protein n=1 Tax=Pleurodeles waltl TaxID=8319 RepID=A0AAV7ME76_PLEWA|nr:hypothetical protein NDU88_006911 [Pleurodeles waltl]